MPRFSTPEPITVIVDSSAANLHVTATDRDDTGVEVRPTNPSRAADVSTAEQTTVELADGRLRITGSATVTGTRADVRIVEVVRGELAVRTTQGHVDIGVSADTAVPNLTTSTRTGSVGNVLHASGDGRALGETATIDLRTVAGDLSIHRCAGDSTVVRA